MYIPQKQLKNLEYFLTPGKVLVVYGARRVGKTTLLKKVKEKYKKNILFVNGDDLIVRQHLESQSIQKLKDFIGQNKLLIIDEAQYVRQVGLNLKLIVDHNPDVKVIASGSSSFDLAKDVGEPLTGRKYVLTLFPLSQLEISQTENRIETDANLEKRLIYGSYPEVVLMQDDNLRQEYLKELLTSYLFKDILALNGLRRADKILELLQLIAFQIGKQVSLNELGTQLGLSKNTVERYLDLLEKVFIIFKRKGFGSNIRKEIAKSSRFYFYDNGVRNAIIHNFNPLNLRNDKGELWENYITVERLKRQTYLRKGTEFYFWRTYAGQEVDLVEHRHGAIYGYEIKFNKAKVNAPTKWKASYPDAHYQVIHRENYLDFIL